MTILTFSNVNVLHVALEVFRKTGDRRYTEGQYDELAAKLAALGNEALARENSIEALLEDVDGLRKALDAGGFRYDDAWASMLVRIEQALRGAR